MGFIESYKHLERLCGDVMNDDRRISAYIDEMVENPRGAQLVPEWDEDLKQLKHYRWVRNKIAHEPDCTESNMCQPGDEQWLDNFYLRIINQTDPLSLYEQARRPRPQHEPKRVSRSDSTAPLPNAHGKGEPREPITLQKSGCLPATIAFLAAVFLALLWLAQQ